MTDLFAASREYICTFTMSQSVGIIHEKGIRNLCEISHAWFNFLSVSCAHVNSTLQNFIALSTNFLISSYTSLSFKYSKIHEWGNISLEREYYYYYYYYYFFYASFVSFSTSNLSDTDLWKEFLSRPSLPFILKFLSGMCKSHQRSQVRNFCWKKLSCSILTSQLASHLFHIMADTFLYLPDSWQFLRQRYLQYIVWNKSLLKKKLDLWQRTWWRL